MLCTCEHFLQASPADQDHSNCQPALLASCDVGEVTRIHGAGRKAKLVYNVPWAEEQEGLCEMNLEGSLLAFTGDLIP